MMKLQRHHLCFFFLPCYIFICYDVQRKCVDCWHYYDADSHVLTNCQNTQHTLPNEWMNEKLQAKQNKTKRNDICVRNYMCSILTDCVLTQLTISGFKKNKIKGAENKYYPSLVISTFPQQLCDCVSEAHLLQNG